MRSGIVYGTAAMLDGLIDRIREEFPGRELSVVATGGSAPVIVRYCRTPIVYDKYLLMRGLWSIYQRNRPAPGGSEPPEESGRTIRRKNGS